MKLEKLNRRRLNLIPWNKSLMSYLTYIWILSSETTGDRKEWKTFGKSYLVTSVLKSIWMYRDWPKLWLLVSIWILEIPNAVVRRLHGRSITLFSTYIVFIRNIVESSSMKTKFDRKRHIQREGTLHVACCSILSLLLLLLLCTWKCSKFVFQYFIPMKRKNATISVVSVTYSLVAVCHCTCTLL